MIDPYRMVFVSCLGVLILSTLLLFYKFVYPKKNINPLLILIAISILPIMSIFREGTYESGDLTSHAVFLQSFMENLRDGILVPQWAGGLCGGYGCPIYIFFYSMPYYMSSVFNFLGFSYIDSIKLFLTTSYILSGITMYLFVRSEFSKTQALVAALLYIFAPIHFIETHFRVSAGTVAAFIFIPLSFLFAKKSLEGKFVYIILGGFNFLFLTLSQPNASFIITGASLVYAFLRRKKFSEITYPILSFLLGLGMIANYLLPVLFEAKKSWIIFGVNSTGDFKPFLEYIYSPARFGLLFQGNHGESRFIIGYTQLFIVLYSFYALVKNKIEKKYRSTVVFLLFSFFTCFILLQSFTKIIWDNIFFLKTFQFAWRLLVPISFITAFLGAVVVKKWKKPAIFILCAITVLITILNWGNRKMVAIDPTAYKKQTSTYTEYYDPNNTVYAKRYEKEINNLNNLITSRPPVNLQMIEGKAEIKELSRTQTTHEYLVYAETEVLLAENTHYFPDWKVYVDSQPAPIDVTNEKNFGALFFKVPPGLHLIKAKFEDTSLRRTAKLISFSTITISSLALLFYLLRTFKNTTHKKNHSKST